MMRLFNTKGLLVANNAKSRSSLMD